MVKNKATIASIKNPVIRRLAIILTLPIVIATIAVVVIAVTIVRVLAANADEAFEAASLARDSLRQTGDAIRDIW